MGFSVKAGGTWKDGTPYVRVGGTWKQPDSLYVKVGGVWKEIYASLAPAFTSKPYDLASFGLGSTNLQVAIQFNTDKNVNGLASGNQSVIGTWGDTALTSSDYELRMVKTTGTETLATGWLNLSTSPLYIFAANQDLRIWSGTAEIRKVGTTNVIDSVSVTLEADAT